MLSEKHLHMYLCVCFYFDSCHGSHHNLVHVLVWVYMCVSQSAVCLPDSGIGFWCLNSLAWPENGKSLHSGVSHLSSFNTALCPASARSGHTRSISFLPHARDVYSSVTRTAHAPKGPKMTCFPLLTGQIIPQTLKPISLLQLFLPDSARESHRSVSPKPRFLLYNAHLTLH